MSPASSSPLSGAVRPRARARWLWRTLVSVGLGSLITISIAWAGAVSGRLNSVSRSDNGGLGYLDDHVITFAMRSKCWSGTRLLWSWRTDLQPVESLSDKSRRFRELVLDGGSAPPWSRVRTWPTPYAGVSQRYLRTLPPDIVARAMMEDGFGWPMRCLSIVYGYDLKGMRWIVAVDGAAIELSGQATGLSGTIQRALPLLPYWPGLLINSALWAAVVFTVLWGWTVLRHRRRVRNGWCTACGYDLRAQRGQTDGDGRCPECGAGFKSARSAI